MTTPASDPFSALADELGRIGRRLDGMGVELRALRESTTSSTEAATPPSGQPTISAVGRTPSAAVGERPNPVATLSGVPVTGGPVLTPSGAPMPASGHAPVPPAGLGPNRPPAAWGAPARPGWAPAGWVQPGPPVGPLPHPGWGGDQQGGPRPTAPAAPRKRSSLTGARLLAWTGGAVTLLGVVLLLALAASRGWFTPPARIAFGAVLGAVLVGLGMWLHRRETARAGALALAGTGFATLYLVDAAATAVYDYLPAVVALLLALLIAGAGLGLADRWRTELLAGGVVVGAVVLAPALADGWLLAALALALQLAALPAVLRRRWAVLMLLAAVGPVLYGCSAVVGEDGATPDVLVVVGVAAAVLVVAAATVALALRVRFDQPAAPAGGTSAGHSGSVVGGALAGHSGSVVGGALAGHSGLVAGGHSGSVAGGTSSEPAVSVAGEQAGPGTAGSSAAPRPHGSTEAGSLGRGMAGSAAPAGSGAPGSAAVSGSDPAAVAEPSGAGSATPGRSAGARMWIGSVAAVVAVSVLPSLVGALVLHDWRGALVAACAALLLAGLALLPATARAVRIAAGTAATVALFTATVVGLNGSAIDIAVLGEALVAALLAVGLRSRFAMITALVLGTLGLISAVVQYAPLTTLLRFDIAPSVAGLVTAIAVSVLLLALSAALLVAGGRLGWVRPDAQRAPIWVPIGLVGLYGAASVVVNAALLIAPTSSGFTAGHAVVTVSWTVAALFLLAHGLRRPALRIAGLVLVGAAVAKLVLFDLVALDGLARVGAFLGAGLVLLAAGTRYARLVAEADKAPPSE